MNKTVCHCEKKENAEIIAKILDSDVDGKIADVVEVVRCKDCKHFIKSINKGCRRRVGYFQPNDFCSYGERK